MNQEPHFYKDESLDGKENDNSSFLNNLENQAGSNQNLGTNEDLSPNGLYNSELGNSVGRNSFRKPNGAGSSKGVKNFFWGSRKRKLLTSGTGVSGGLVGLLLAILFTAAGPAQLVQLSHVLQGDFKNSNNTMSRRMNQMFTNTGPADDLGQTRLGIIGSQFLNPIKTRLANAGITFETNTSNGLKSVHIDVKTLRASNPELSGYDTEQMRQYVADTLNVDSIIVKGTGTFNIDAVDYGNSVEFPLAISRMLLSGSLDLLNSGKILTGISLRVLKTYYDAPSLFHPIDLAKAKLRQIAITKVESNAEEEASVQEDVVTGLDQSTGLDAVRASLKSAFDGTVGNLLAKALIGTAVLCAVRNAAGNVILYNRDAIVLPAALEAVRMVAVGDQVESGNDISAGLAGGAANGLVDSNGQSVWAAKSLQVTENRTNPSGPDLSTKYASAFNSNTTQSNLVSGISISAGGINFTGAVCSPLGQAVQGLAGIIYLVANIPDGESLSFGTWAAEQAGTTVAFGGSLYFLEKEITNILKSNATVPAVLGGPSGGNLLAYGAREAANIGAVADGGVALSGSQTTAMINSQQKQNQQQFRSQSFFARIFNIDDNSTLLGRLADYIQPSLAGMSREISGLFNFTHLFSDIFSLFSPKAAASSQPYNWGFPVYGVPPELLDSTDPSLQNPYANANIVAGVLNNYNNTSSPLYGTANDLIKEASTCFGDNVTKTSGVWDVLHMSDVDPNSSQYVGADCSDLSVLPYWNRMILFVSDTSTAQAYGCWQGDATSCSETGN